MDRFAICQAFLQLESDYNVGGWLRERPSNQRRRESVGVQLLRMGYSNPYGWVDIEAEFDPEGDPFGEEVRAVYIDHVLKWGLPMSGDLMRQAERIFTPEYLAKFPAYTG